MPQTAPTYRLLTEEEVETLKPTGPCCQGHTDHRFCSCGCGLFDPPEYPDAVWADDEADE